MGNNTSNFVNLDEVSKEKSLFSFNVTLVKLSVKIKKKELTKNMPNYKFKLKLYPSTLTLKNENCNIIDFSYYNIKSWVNDKKFFSFETIDGDSYMFLTDNIDSSHISMALTGICKDIKKKDENNKNF